METPPVPPIGGGYVGATSPSTAQMPALSDDLLLEIFLRIRCPADLARASVACVAFHRLITDPIFIRRYRSHHPPLLLGFISCDPSKGFYPIEAPHPNAPAARAVPKISFVHLPQAERNRSGIWYTVDVRDGRVLLECSGRRLPHFAVCDPLSGRCLMLPPVPHYRDDEDLSGYSVALAPLADNNKDDASFKVICGAYYFTELVFLVFDSGCGSWTMGTCSTWGALSLCNRPELSNPHHAYGCIYWKVYGCNRLLKLDINRMLLSTVVLPPGHGTRQVAVAEVGEGTLGMFCYSHIRHRKVLKYYHYSSKTGHEWQMKNVIPLPAHGSFLMDEAHENYIFMRLALNLEDHEDIRYYYYSLDIKTLELESQMRCYQGYMLPYFSFPPSLSPRVI